MSRFNKVGFAALAVVGGLIGTAAWAISSSGSDGVCSLSVSGGYAGVEDGSVDPNKVGYHKYSVSASLGCPTNVSSQLQVWCSGGGGAGMAYVAGGVTMTDTCWVAPNQTSWQWNASRIDSGLTVYISGPVP